ncbi:biotin carboxylase N-terminal domain-containing protein [Noviherbaspirillum sp.]|uniref:ATP-binding protein n=1 Tax=Noviherbaspirillum sp. TaxID=1926288 RepID=UPI002D3C24A0|nr:biotin carboxylase N-terminal domain-containing protein [Noviherbaspirillum sp.]HZW19719.1 biotin carboxylase N-terminal domain-containing protein [Noviherbaspirillum sp.]
MHTLLIANRGEIAVRIMRSARRMGLRTAAVYSEPDRSGVHAEFADSAMCIGAGPARESYLNTAAILDAARRLGADAVHPGYGFLAENADFAQAVLDAGLTWVGPPPSAMRAMGNKAGAKRLLLERGVPLLPGYQGTEQSEEALLREARRIGLPLMIKAAAGGGGRGMRLVMEEKDLPSQLARARSEALQAFGSGELILERALISPRHVEVQVFADTQGNVIHLGERDCSVQRRHQKIIEESPSPAVTPPLRARLGAAAVEAARACGYAGAGTVEFLLDATGGFWFMEMNTRLQVEHPVTEAITGLDLVEWQLRVAAGELLPLTQAEIDARLATGGHAIEVRLCAEDPARDFLPQAGKIALWCAPSQQRVDHALRDGAVVPAYYDSMVAKLIAHGTNREEARQRLLQQLGECVLLGLPTNQDFLADCLAHPDFAEGRATTGFIDACFPLEKRQSRSDSTATVAAAALVLASRQASAERRFPAQLAGWNSTGAMPAGIDLELDGTRHRCEAQANGPNAWLLRGEGFQASVAIAAHAPGLLQLNIDGASVPVAHALQDGKIHFRHAGRNHVAEDAGWRPAKFGRNDSSDGLLRAPMNGKVTVMHVRPGEKVSAGQPILVLEAMKMEHSVAAPCDGVIKVLHVAGGEQVAPGKILAEIAS